MQKAINAQNTQPIKAKVPIISSLAKGVNLLLIVELFKALIIGFKIDYYLALKLTPIVSYDSE